MTRRNYTDLDGTRWEVATPRPPRSSGGDPAVTTLGGIAACGGTIGGIAGALAFAGAVLGACIALGPLGWLLAIWAVPAAFAAGGAAGGALGAVVGVPVALLIAVRLCVSVAGP
jgi:hypothetical protein